jgi:hypothetical protein
MPQMIVAGSTDHQPGVPGAAVRQRLLAGLFSTARGDARPPPSSASSSSASTAWARRTDRRRSPTRTARCSATVVEGQDPNAHRVNPEPARLQAAQNPPPDRGQERRDVVGGDGLPVERPDAPVACGLDGGVEGRIGRPLSGGRRQLGSIDVRPGSVSGFPRFPRPLRAPAASRANDVRNRR